MASLLREFRFETLVLIVSLFGVTSVSWVLSSQPFLMMGMHTMYQLDLASILLFSVTWSLGMIAMMFPTVTPMTLTLFRAARSASPEIKAGGGPTIAKAWIFVISYTLLWIGFGGILYVGLSIISFPSLMQSPYLRLVPSFVVMLAGLYQFLPIKGECLSRCHPTSFLISNFRGGMRGSAHMGASYGVYCIGCCWVLMIVLLLVGAMSLTWMGMFAVAILFERVYPKSWHVSKIIGVSLLFLGIILLI